jgi:hypothetical protein
MVIFQNLNIGRFIYLDESPFVEFIMLPACPLHDVWKFQITLRMCAD